MSVFIRGRWLVQQFLHSGGFGENFIVEDKETGETQVAKLEKLDSKHPTLLYEFLLYKRFQNGVGIPRMIGFCEDGLLFIYLLV
jgi:hypothetical protein